MEKWNETAKNEMEMSLSSKEVYSKIYSEEDFELLTELSFDPNDKENNDLYENFLNEAEEGLDTDLSTVRVKKKAKVNQRDYKIKCLMIALLPKTSQAEIDEYLSSTGHTTPKVSRSFIKEINDYRKEMSTRRKPLQLVADRDAVILTIASDTQLIQQKIEVPIKCLSNGQLAWF